MFVQIIIVLWHQWEDETKPVSGHQASFYDTSRHDAKTFQNCLNHPPTL
jgi:hypothetical protein